MNYRIAAILLALPVCGILAQTHEHAEASMVLRLPASPAVVFPLFGPVRESEWSPRWNPTILYPRDRSQQSGAVFTTRQHDQDVVWVLTTYDAAALRISYVTISPGRIAGQLDIALKAIGENGTEATLTHRWTSLAADEDGGIKTLAAQFPLERPHWEHAISARLHELTGR